jgi:hypothetical protein
MNMKEWKGRYIYLDMHQLFFAKFPFLLHEWLKRQAYVNSVALPVEPIVWDQTKIDSLKVLDNKWSHPIHFWFTRVKKSYIIKFAIEYSVFFNKVEIKFEECPRKRMLEKIPLWIKMLFMEIRMMCMDPNRMDD